MKLHRNYLFTLLTLLGLSILSSQAWAHYPTLDCQLENPNEQAQLVCIAGYSDGSVAFDEVVEVRGYDETLLHSLITDQDGVVRFSILLTPYYVLFDPGHEDPAEFDYAEL